MFWYFLAGKIATLINYFSFYELTTHTISYDPLPMHIFSGWFFIEHIFEEYTITSGKLFLINKNFRTLTRNLLLLNRNILFWPQISKLAEFLLIIFLLSLFFYCLIYLIIQNQLFKKKEVTLLLYYLFISYILLLKVFTFLNWFNIYFTLKLIILFFVIFLSILVMLLQTIVFYRYLLFNLKNISSKSVFLKSYFYALSILLLSFNYCRVMFAINLNSDNFIQELFIQILLPYTYLYSFYT